MTSELNMLTLPVGPRDHARGPSNAPATVVEYGDYECTFCGRAHVVVSELIPYFGDRMRFVFRNFPLTSMHPHAQMAAKAAEAAGTQGKFWDMHDLLFRNQHALDVQSLTRYAALLGLDLPRFAHELTSHAHSARVREDFMSGVRSGVNGTPTFFINGVRHDGSYDFKTLAAAIQAASKVAATAP